MEFEAEFLGVKGVTVMLKGKGRQDLRAAARQPQPRGMVRYVEQMSKIDKGSEFIDWTECLRQHAPGPLCGY